MGIIIIMSSIYPRINDIAAVTEVGIAAINKKGAPIDAMQYVAQPYPHIFMSCLVLDIFTCLSFTISM